MADLGSVVARAARFPRPIDLVTVELEESGVPRRESTLSLFYQVLKDFGNPGRIIAMEIDLLLGH